METPEKIKSIDALIDSMRKTIFGKNIINCLKQMSTILSQSNDNEFKDNIFTHLRNKLQLAIANYRILNSEIITKRKTDLNNSLNKLFVCKIKKEYPDIYNKLIPTLPNLNINLNNDSFNTSIKNLELEINKCDLKSTSTNSQADLIEKLQQEILNLKKQQGDQTLRTDGLSVNDACKPREIQIYKDIYTDIYNQIRSILYTFGSKKKDSLKLVASADNVDVIKQNNIDNFLILNESINEHIRESNLKTAIAPPTGNLDELTRLREKDSKWTNLAPYLVPLININKDLIQFDLTTSPTKAKEVSDKIAKLKELIQHASRNGIQYF
jgi:hypothetical protein